MEGNYVGPGTLCFVFLFVGKSLNEPYPSFLTHSILLHKLLLGCCQWMKECMCCDMTWTLYPDKVSLCNGN